VEHVLEHWTFEQMREHLEQVPAAVLDSNADERKFAEYKPAQKS
jgi:hypothetical protein